MLTSISWNYWVLDSHGLRVHVCMSTQITGKSVVVMLILVTLSYKQHLVLKAIARCWYITCTFFMKIVDYLFLLWSFLVIWIILLLIIRMSSFMDSFIMKCITYLRFFYISLSYKILVGWVINGHMLHFEANSYFF